MTVELCLQHDSDSDSWQSHELVGDCGRVGWTATGARQQCDDSGRWRRHRTDVVAESARRSRVAACQDDGPAVGPLAATHSPDPRRPAPHHPRHQGSPRRRPRAGRGRGGGRRAARPHAVPGRVGGRRALAHLLPVLAVRRVVARGARILLGVRRQLGLARLNEGGLHHQLPHQEPLRSRSQFTIILCVHVFNFLHYRPNYSIQRNEMEF